MLIKFSPPFAFFVQPGCSLFGLTLLCPLVVMLLVFPGSSRTSICPCCLTLPLTVQYVYTYVHTSVSRRSSRSRRPPAVIPLHCVVFIYTAPASPLLTLTFGSHVACRCVLAPPALALVSIALSPPPAAWLAAISASSFRYFETLLSLAVSCRCTPCI